MTAQTDPTTGVLKLSGDMTILQIESLKEALSGPIASGADLVVDLSETGACDFTALQLLYAATRSARMQGHRLEMVHPSSAFTHSISHLGFPSSLTPST